MLAEVKTTSGARETINYAVFLPAMVRTAPAIGDRQLAERLVGGFEPRYPYAEHAIVAANAALAEAGGDLDAGSSIWTTRFFGSSSAWWGFSS